jgi:type IV fimbrial biogenesis protein FimT
MAVRNADARGYTLSELMAVLAIASALLVIAIPMLRTQVLNARMSAAATDLQSTLMSAKSEAVGRNYPVRVCIRNEDADACVSNGQWEDGWLSFVDTDSDGNLDSGEEVLQIHPVLADGLTARATNTLANGVTYLPNGLTDLGGTQGLIFCDARGYDNFSRALTVSILGKASVLKPEETGTILTDEQAVRGQCLRG